MITDTQVLSYYHKGALPAPSEPIRISSITAAEFLLIQSEDHNKANYYPILPSRLRHHGEELGTIEWPNGAEVDPDVLHGDFEPAETAAIGAARASHAER